MVYYVIGIHATILYARYRVVPAVFPCTRHESGALLAAKYSRSCGKLRIERIVDGRP